MPRKSQPQASPVDNITDRVMELTRGIYDTEQEIKDLEVFLYGHEGPPRDVNGVISDIADINREIEAQERVIREAQAFVNERRKTLAELTARKESTEAKVNELQTKIETNRKAVRAIVSDTYHHMGD